MLQLQTRILQLAWPIMLSNITVPLLGLVDTAVLGHLSDVQYLGAVALGSQVLTLMLWSFGFLRMGTTSLSAQAVGENQLNPQLNNSIRILYNGLFLAAVISIPLLMASFLMLDNIIMMIGGSAEVQKLASEYVGIRLYATPAVLFQYVLIGWFIGRGETKVPLLILIVSNSINAALDIILVYGYGMTSNGVAVASAVADYSAASLGIYMAYRTLKKEHSLEGFILKWPTWVQLKPMVNINHQLFVRTLCLLSVFIFFTAQGAKQGDLILAVNAIMLTILLLISNALDGFAHAAEALVGQKLAAKQYNQLQQSIWLTGINAFIIALLMAVLFGWQSENLLALLTDQQDVLFVAKEYSLWLIWLPLIGFSSYWLDGIFIGMQASAQMRNSMILAVFLVFLPTWYGTQDWGNHGLWAAFYAFLLARSVFMIPAFINMLKNTRTA